MADTITITGKDDKGATQVKITLPKKGKPGKFTIDGPGKRQRTVEWTATLSNSIGGWTGIGKWRDPVGGTDKGSVEIDVHCPDKPKPKKGDKPSITIRAKGQEPETYFIDEDDQKDINKHLEETPKEIP